MHFLPWFCYVTTTSRIKWFDPWHNCSDARNKSWFLKGLTIVVFFASTCAEQKEEREYETKGECRKKKQIEKSAQRQRTGDFVRVHIKCFSSHFCFVPLLPLLPFLSFQFSHFRFPSSVFSFVLSAQALLKIVWNIKKKTATATAIINGAMRWRVSHEHEHINAMHSQKRICRQTEEIL